MTLERSYFLVWSARLSDGSCRRRASRYLVADAQRQKYEPDLRHLLSNYISDYFFVSIFLISGLPFKLSLSQMLSILSMFLSPLCVFVQHSSRLSFGLPIFRCPVTSIFHVFSLLHLPLSFSLYFLTISVSSLIHRCQQGLKQMRDVLLFFADFPLTFTTSTRFAILKNLNEVDVD